MKKMLFLAVALVFVLASCDEFFTTSLGTPRKVNTSTISEAVTTDNIDDWVTRAKGDSTLSDELVGVFKDKAKNGSTAEERAAFGNGGISAATAASHTGSIIISDGLDSLTDMLETNDFTPEAGIALFDNIMTGFKESTTAKKSSEDVAEIAGLFVDLEGGSVPTFSPEFVEAIKPEEAGMTMVLLAMAVADEKEIDVSQLDSETDFSTLVDELGTTDGGKITVTGDVTPKTKALAAYINLVTQNDKFKDDLLSGAFGELLGGKSGPSSDAM